MGYKAPKKIYKLVFEDHDGLIVRAKSAPLGMFLELSALADVNPESVSSEDVEQVNKLFEMFAEYLVDWNLEDENDKPVPATMAGMLSQDIEFVLEIIGAWMQTIASVSLPKGMPSSDGKQFPEGSLPMEPLFPSQQN